MNDNTVVPVSRNPVPSMYTEQKLGKLLLDAGKLMPQDAEKILRLQKSEGLRFGEAAVKLGLVNEEDIRIALSQQFDYPYLQPGEGGFSADLVAAYQPFTTQMEQLRALRSQLMLRWFTLGHKSLAFVGTAENEGLSNLVANLAVVFSQLGERTLLIDANLRNPQQHHLFNLGNRPGLSYILIGRADNSAATRMEAFVGLSVLTAGTVPPNPAELLARPRFAQMMEICQSQFDVILLDTSPVAEADAVGVCAQAGGALLVARQDYTRINDLNWLATQIGAAHAAVLGVVLNQF